MSYNVKIYGAGSIGNHLAYACRTQGWRVVMYDHDAEALRRTREEIYPARYGGWDEEIELVDASKDGSFDIVIIGTPPETHVDIALMELQGRRQLPKVILIEKPLCGLGLTGCDQLVSLAREKGVAVCVGYNHVLTNNTRKAAQWIKDGHLDDPRTISVEWVEHWGGIFAAHPWLDGPADSYLGHANMGGGACGEHSHGINMWQHFSHLLGMGRVVEVTAVMDKVEGDGVDYDRIAQLSLVTENGLTGYVVQDVITHPARKMLRVQGKEEALVWIVNKDNGHDAVELFSDGKWEEHLISKTRPDDFVNEIRHVGQICGGSVQESPVSLERGLETMLVVEAAHRSAREKRSVSIDYAGGVSSSCFK